MPESSISPVSSTPTAGLTKRACDCCHKRKVKCIGDGTRPCRNCASAGLACTYNAVPQKKGPKGNRAKVISELRENQQRHSGLSSSISKAWKSPGVSLSTTTSPSPGLLSPELITACADFFFTNIYPSQPILQRQKLADVVAQAEHDVEAYCLITALCAYMLIQPNMTQPPGSSMPPVTGHGLLQETLRIRKTYDYTENPTVLSVITSFFLFGSHFCLDKNNVAWFHLREATTLAHIIRMHEEDSYVNLDSIEASRRRHLYWLLFVTERAYALQRHRPLSLHATIELPSPDDESSDSVELSGFLHLVQLFRPFDDTFVGFWNKTRVGCSTEWLVHLQKQLSSALPSYLQSTETQAVDLKVSQQWLKTMVWQLSISHGYLSSTANDDSMTFNYPIELARELIAVAPGFSQMAMEVHGIGLIEKLFDVACTLTDVMACVPIEQSHPQFEFGPRDYLHQYLSLISSLRGGRQRYLPLLVTKISDSLPSSAPALGYAISPNPSHGSNGGSYIMSNGHQHARDEKYNGHIDHAGRQSGSGHTSAIASPDDSPPPHAAAPVVSSAFQYEPHLARARSANSPLYVSPAGATEAYSNIAMSTAGHYHNENAYIIASNAGYEQSHCT